VNAFHAQSEEIEIQPPLVDEQISGPVQISLNLHRRRHLTPLQKAMVAAKYREYFDKAAKERMQERKGNQPGARVENLPHLENAGTSRKLSVRCPPFHKDLQFKADLAEKTVVELLREKVIEILQSP